MYREKSDFLEKTGIHRVIELTEIGQYACLLEQIETHQAVMQKGTSLQDAATDWYDTIYEPLLGIIERSRLLEYFPNRTFADLYAYISYHQWQREAPRQYGVGINQYVPPDMEEFRKRMMNQKKSQYPEMIKEITAFILLMVEAKREVRVFDKLFDMEEIKEVHAIHGNVDILAKIVLKRDLLTSDAQTIGEFVHNRVRQIPGVISTQTLIPSLSRTRGV